MLIALHKDATAVDQLHACVQAEVLEFIITHNGHWNDKVCITVQLLYYSSLNCLGIYELWAEKSD